MVPPSTEINHQTNNSSELKYVLLSYEDGRKIRIPIDINKLNTMNTDNNNNTNPLELLSSDGGNKTNTYLSDSMREQFSDENNKIVSAVLMDSNSNKNKPNNIIEIVSSDNSASIPALPQNNNNNNDQNNAVSPINVIIEDMDEKELQHLVNKED